MKTLFFNQAFLYEFGLENFKVFLPFWNNSV